MLFLDKFASLVFIMKVNGNLDWYVHKFNIKVVHTMEC